MPNMNPAELTDFVKQIFIGAGAEPATAELVARSLVLSDMAGHESHGTVRVRQYLDQIGRGDINPTAEPEIVMDNGAVFNVDANSSFGQLSASFTISEAVKRAKEHGISAAGLFHSGHVGRLGEWVEMAADENTIALAYCNGGGPSPGRVAPFGGARADPGYESGSGGHPRGRRAAGPAGLRHERRGRRQGACGAQPGQEHSGGLDAGQGRHAHDQSQRSL